MTTERTSTEPTGPTGAWPDFDERRADLVKRGYGDTEEAGGIKVGSRVHNRGEQFPRAYREGTATVAAVMEKDPSSWSLSYGRRDIEVIVQRDQWRVEQGLAEFSTWADYGTCLVVAPDVT